MGKPCYLGVLFGYALLRVNHNQTYITALDGHGGAEHAVFLHIFLYLGLSSHPGSVDKNIFSLLVFKL